MTGSTSPHIFQINVSAGGVPKRSSAAAWISTQGVEGDHQRNQEVHGGPLRAVCLYSLENILALQEEGHPIYPGAIGENLTLAGVDWQTITPGMQVNLGEGVLLEITKFTTPCNNLTDAFLSGDYGRVSQNQHPGWARVYARVLVEGRVRPGDRVILQPAPPGA